MADDLFGLPDPDLGRETLIDPPACPDVSQMVSMPPGHPPASMETDAAPSCPFALLSSHLSQRSQERTMQIPEIDRSMHTPLVFSQLEDSLDTVQEGKAMVDKKALKQESAKGFTPQKSMRMEKMGSKLDDTDGASEAPSGSMAKSKMTKKTRKSKMSASSKLQQGAVRRTRKAPTFSAWEAQNYIPIIKQSWLDILKQVSIEEVGVVFYDKLFDVGGEGLKHMFTTERSIMAVKFAEMLAAIVASVDNPFSMYQKLQGLAPMHIEKGVGKQHLPIMGETLFSVLEGVLKEKFSVQVRTAWEWLWAWLGATFTQSIEEAGNRQTPISIGWNMAMDNYPDEALGELLYDTLFELAPNLKQVFSKPRQILSVKFVEMMSTLVSFHEKLDDHTYNEQLCWLGVRHVSYQAKFSHVDVLGQVLLATMSTAIGGEDWTEEMEEAWGNLWTDTCHRLLSITNEAHQHGVRAQEMWKLVKQRTTRAQFGKALRRLLLSGTEWVQSLSAKSAAEKKAAEEKGNGGSVLSNSRTKSVEADPKEMAAMRKHSTHSNATELDKKEGEGGEAASGDRTDAEAIGHQFWEFITVVLDLLWEPERQNEQLILMTTRFFKAGIRNEHLTGIGTAIETACRRSLDTAWNDQYKEAWAWIWKLVEQAMRRTLNVLEQDHAQKVRESWEKCKNKMETVELGESIFKELASIAPYLVHLFKRPKRIQAAQFVSAIDLLVSFLEDPDTFFVELKQLTIRHIKYGVKADYAKAFGTAVLRGIENAIGKEEFPQDLREAWELLWDRVSNCLTRCLNAGTNLVIVALVNGDLEKAKEAMDCAPRGERFDTLTLVDVNGEKLSPLKWAIRDGMRDIALYIIEDILSIRADRHKYYYGREKLFETHPDIVELLCKDPGAEVLLDTLFNGLLWHSNTVTQGKLRVNYYIKELYGDPEQEPNAWNSAMATLSLHAPPAVFDHPVCQMLLKSKWDTFGKKMFFGIQAFYFLILVLYYVCFVANDEMCGNNGIIRLVTGVIALLSAVVQLGLAARQWWSGLTGEFKLSYPRWLSNMPFIGQRLPAVLNIPRTLLNVFNLLRVPIYIAVAVIAFSEICVGGMTPPEHSGTLNMLASIVALVMGLQLLEVFMLQVQVASFMLVVQFLVGDVLRALLVILIVLIAFGAALGITMDVEFEGGLFDVVHKLVHLNLDMEKGLVAEGNAYSVTLVSIIVVICQVTIFNVLIAQLVSKGSGINQWTHLMVSKKFAYVCVEMESLIPMNYRIMFFKRMRFDDPLDFENGDDGPSGGIQVLEPGWIRSDPKYVPDRILRFTGDSSEKDPWPSQTINDDPHDEYD